MENNKEKNFSPILFEENHYQHIRNTTFWNEVCFIVLNHPEDLMLHVFHNPFVTLLQSLMKGEFSKFMNATIVSSGKVKFPFSEFISMPKEVECKL